MTYKSIALIILSIFTSISSYGQDYKIEIQNLNSLTGVWLETKQTFDYISYTKNTNNESQINGRKLILKQNGDYSLYNIYRRICGNDTTPRVHKGTWETDKETLILTFTIASKSINYKILKLNSNTLVLKRIKTQDY